MCHHRAHQVHLIGGPAPRWDVARADALEELKPFNIPADIDALTSALAAVSTEVGKVPRLGQTYKYRNVISDEEADVTIEPAS